MTAQFQPHNPERFAAAIAAFDHANSQDPNTELAEGRSWPRELLYAQRLTDWVLRLDPAASEPLRLAARSQHLCRWEIPRESYPATRPGYLKWRHDLKKHHAQKSGEILASLGYPSEIIHRVQALNLKQDLATDPDAATLEDALCLLFLQHQFADLVSRSTEEKMINAVQKTWKKMTPRAHAEALKLPYADRELAILKKALPL